MEANWGMYVVDELVEGARKVKDNCMTGSRRPYLYGCCLVLEALYFDSVETGFVQLDPAAEPRIKFYTPDLVKLLIKRTKWDTAHCKGRY